MRPAIGLLEFDSIAAGIRAGDAMVKRGPVSGVVAGTVHPGKYLVLVWGEVAAVEEALTAGRSAGPEGVIVDELFLPDVHPAVADAIRGVRTPGAGEAVGVIETATVAAAVEAADAAVKGAGVYLMELNLADGLGGKGYALFCGTVPDVEAAVSIGSAQLTADDLVGTVVIPQLQGEMGDNLLADRRFGVRLGRDDATG